MAVVALPRSSPRSRAEDDTHITRPRWNAFLLLHFIVVAAAGAGPDDDAAPLRPHGQLFSVSIHSSPGHAETVTISGGACTATGTSEKRLCRALLTPGTRSDPKPRKSLSYDSSRVTPSTTALHLGV